jgi:hypothetical protein
MDHNLIVSFEIRDPLRESALIVGAIEELGAATRVFGSTWYVRSQMAASDAARFLWTIMDPLDTLVVIDVSHNATAMFNVDDRCVQFMSRYWHRSLDRVEHVHHLPEPYLAAAPPLVAHSAG